MSQELIIHFNSPTQFTVRYEEGETSSLTFTSPITDADYQDIRWYLETYSSSYTAEPDEGRAQRIGQQLPTWGEALFNAVLLQDRTAPRLFGRLQDEAEEERYVTISAVFPEILGLPWELLKDPDGVYLFNENPRIAIRRSLRTGGGRRARKVKTKESVRLLFIISRPLPPDRERVIDPRAEAQAVLAALAKKGIGGQVQVEFLRQATFDALLARLENEELPPVDIVHFDGHGVFDGSGQLGNSGKVVAIERPGMKKTSADVANMGYLLFEDDQGKEALVSAEMLGQMLHQQQVSMMVLSACQSAKVAGEDALGSVAVRLVLAGMPSVVAMTHSVLVKTTELLFQDFYAQLANGQGVGEALENARRYLFRHPGRGTRCYGEREVKLELQDWFIPSLYQTGADVALLTKKKSPGAEDSRAALANWGNLPSLQEVGFVGRAQELWELERWLLQGARRVTIAGFGGQGKTYLAIELGQWLWQKGWFAKVVFVDYKAFQGVDAVGYAVSSVAVVLGENLLDAQAARVALGKVATLVILDNLESLAPALLQELLTVAAQWSQIGETRVLLTTRQLTDFAHPEFPAAGSLKHRVLSLDGLRAEDAVAYYQRLMTLPPASSIQEQRSEKQLKELFRLVQCHPLSINLLAQLLKTQRLERLEKRLDQLVAASPDNLVLASLQLSLERLDKEAQPWLPLLGVFQGGAMEYDLLAITEIPPATWSQLRPLLESTGLIKVEHLTNIGTPYLQFHPTLAPALWSRLDCPQQQTLRQRYQQRYYALSRYLYNEDQRNPLEARAIVKHELSNLLSAVKGALAEATDYAVEFVECVNQFLDYFGLQRDRAALTQQAAKLAGEVGSQNWFLSKTSVGEQLFSAGHYTEATQVFHEILNGLGTATSYERCLTLGRLGRCFSFQGQAPQAVAYYQQGLAIAQQLEPTPNVQRQTGVLYADLADALRNMGSYPEAKQADEQSIIIAQKIDDHRMVAIGNGQLGTLALLQGNLAEAEQRYQAALASFQDFNEPGTEAMYWHQLGVVYQKAQQWEAAEHAYRQSAHLEEAQGHLQGAAQTWNQLARVTESMGKWDDAEAWYRKVIEVFQTFGDMGSKSKVLNNLANLLQNQPDRLTEARQLVEEALAIKKTLDPAPAEIWTTYHILADIADKQGEVESAKDYRRLARSAKANFAGTRYELKRVHSELILAVARGEKVEAALTSYGKGWDNLKTAIQQIVAGERDKERLCEPLNFGEAPIVYAILDGLAEPGSLKWLEEGEGV